MCFGLASNVVSIFVDILVESKHTVFVNSTNIITNIETAALSILDLNLLCFMVWFDVVGT